MMWNSSRSKKRRASRARRFMGFEEMEGRSLMTGVFVGPLQNPPQDPPPTPTPAQPTFTTIEEAAEHWGNQFNGPSITEGQEYGSTIYENDDGTYSYTEPAQGGNDAVVPSRPTGGQTVVADIHSHGMYEAGYDNNHFSPTDTADNDQQQIPGFLTSPNGNLQMYDPATQATTVINSDMPSDPNDPDRQNTVDP